MELRDEISKIEIRHKMQNNEVLKEKDTLEFESKTVNSDIKEMIKKIREGRRKEISLLEKSDAIKHKNDFLSKKAGALFMTLSAKKNSDFSDFNILLRKKIAEEYDKDLSDALKRNIEFKKEIEKMKDYIELLNVYQVESVDDNDMRRMDVDSNISHLSSVNNF